MPFSLSLSAKPGVENNRPRFLPALCPFPVADSSVNSPRALPRPARGIEVRRRCRVDYFAGLLSAPAPVDGKALSAWVHDGHAGLGGSRPVEFCFWLASEIRG